MILSKKPLSLADVKTLVVNLEEKLILAEYIKKFSSLDKTKSDNLKDEIESLKNPKIKADNIIKVIDFLPKDSEELNKIFNEVSLSEEETNALLSIIKKY